MRKTMIIMLAFILVMPVTAQADVDVATLNDFIEEQMAMQHIPGLALAIIKDDTIVHMQGYGDDITPQTQFFIASVSKSFTALAVMQLIESGQINLDAPVQSYLPDFTIADPDTASYITIRHLLNQTSGLADTGFPYSTLPQPRSLVERTRSLQTAVPISEPGMEFNYFNPNYDVLAHVVEVVSGQSFAEYLDTQVFEPLAMPRTFSTVTSDDAIAQSTQLASGHLLIYGFPTPVRELSGYLGGSGGIISTVEDLAHFLIVQNNRGIFDGTRIISSASLERMHTPPSEIDSTYAMGWITSRYGNMHVIGHNGILSAYYAEVVLLPETGYGIVLLYNVNSMSSAALAFPQIKAGLIDIVTGNSPPSSPLSVTIYSIVMALVTLSSLLLALRSLLRLPHWYKQHQHTSLIRLLPGFLLRFVPILMLLLLPGLTALSGRVFSIQQLFRFMPDIYLWLGTLSILSVINGSKYVLLYISR